MRANAPFLLVAGLALSCGSCGGSQEASAPSGPGGNGGDAALPGQVAEGGTGSLPCDVDAVLAANCRQCHASPPLFGSPMPLVTYADLHAPSKSDASIPVFQQVYTRTHDDAKPMPPAPNARLDASSQAVLDAWIAAGAPSGTGTGQCSPPPSPDGGMSANDAGPPPTDCVPDTHIAPATPYTMTSPEVYACYGFDVTPAQKRHVTEIRVHLDNAQIVHHVLLLASSSSVSGTPTQCDPAPSLGDGMLYAWAPGGLPLVVPTDAGFPEDQTTHYMVQIHYNNSANVAKPVDSTGFDLCTTSTLRKYDADVVAFGTESILLFPHATGSTTSCYTAPAAMDGRHFFASFPHMHKLGKSITTSLVPQGGGSPVDMGTDNAWDFSTQPWLGINATAHTGDVIKTTCSWNNTSSQIVTFGQSTTNEMCYSFSAYYPKLTTSSGWAAPASSSVACQ